VGRYPDCVHRGSVSPYFGLSPFARSCCFSSYYCHGWDKGAYCWGVAAAEVVIAAFANA